MNLSTIRIVTTLVFLATALLCCGFVVGQGKGKGKGGKGGSGGNSVSQDIAAVLTVPDPATISAGTLKSDGANGNTYSNLESSISVLVGRRRTITLEFGKNATRSMRLQLGAELSPENGDNNDPNAAAAGKINFFANNNVPDPSANGGVVTDIWIQIGGRENVSALGAFPVDETPPNYCYPDWTEVPDENVDPNDPDTFSRMCTTMRMNFKSGAHKWVIFFGPPNRRVAAIFQPTHPDAGAVRVKRDLPSGDPLDKTVPWETEAMPWNTANTMHPRYGKVVGYLFYAGTKRQDPTVYAGAFEVHWADGVNKWTTLPL